MTNFAHSKVCVLCTLCTIPSPPPLFSVSSPMSYHHFHNHHLIIIINQCYNGKLPLTAMSYWQLQNHGQVSGRKWQVQARLK